MYLHFVFFHSFIYCFQTNMDVTEDFYIHLVSKFNKVEYPENSSSGFTNILNPCLNLKAKFKVGLENIIFKPDLYLVEKNNDKYSIFLGVEFLDETGGVQSGYNVHYRPEENIYADNIFQLIQHLNNDLETFLTRQKVITPNTNFIFRLRHFSTFVEYKPLSILKPENYVNHRITWTFGSSLMKILGLRSSSYTDKIIFSLKPEFPKMMECLYIYTDIITPTSFGGEDVHLFDIIPM